MTGREEVYMLSFEEVGEILDDFADELPEGFYKQLNGGIVLLPDTKIHPKSKAQTRLYVLGEYHYQRYGLGRYIAIYYGSFTRVCSHMNVERQKEQLKKTLLHEFTHHLESLAGEKGLEIKDAIKLKKFMDSQPPKT